MVRAYVPILELRLSLLRSCGIHEYKLYKLSELGILGARPSVGALEVGVL